MTDAIASGAPVPPARAQGRGLAKSSLWNLVGQLAPVPAALIAIPAIVERCGTDRFGVLTLAWMLVGYFSLFDLGLGRALTQLIAERIGRGETNGLGSLTWSGLALMAMLGMIGGGALLGFSHLLVRSVLKIPPELQGEAQDAFYMLALCVPFAVTTAGLRGVLEALHRFDVTNAVRVPLGLLTYIAPLVAVIFVPSLVALVGALVVVRFIGWAVHLYFCLRCMPALRERFVFEPSSTRMLLRFGGWMTISNIVSPVMAYFDRFLIGSIVSVTMLAYYTTPFELVSRVSLLPSAISGVLFPAFAARHIADLAGTERLVVRATKLLAILLAPVVLILVIFAHEILHFWMGSNFASRSTISMQWLAFGTFINCLAYIPFAFIQGIGRPRITALIHLAELPCYVLTLWMLTHWNGIDGAALAWTLRVALDAAILFSVTAFLLPGRRRVLSLVASASLVVAATSLVGLLIDGVIVRCLVVGTVVAACLALLWFRGFDDEEKSFLRRLRVWRKA